MLKENIFKFNSKGNIIYKYTWKDNAFKKVKGKKYKRHLTEIGKKALLA